MPVRYAFITILPITSLRSTAPVFEISRFTLSNVSMNISFFRYVMPSRRQSIAPVICDVIVLSSSVWLLRRLAQTDQRLHQRNVAVLRVAVVQHL